MSVLVDVKDHVATVTISRPEALNALNTATLKELDDAFVQLEGNADVYTVIVTGAGDKSFVAGADIAEMKDKDVAAAAEFARVGNAVFSRIEKFRCPVIAAVNGFALGGGCELSMACDIRIASTKALFGQPEVGLGITPGFGGTQRLARLVSPGIAKELIYSCRNVKADEALKIGLVNSVVEPEQLMETAVSMAQTICKKAPLAVSYAKKAINEGLQLDIDGGIAVEVREFGNCFATEDQKIGMTAFLNKEKGVQFKNK